MPEHRITADKILSSLAAAAALMAPPDLPKAKPSAEAGYCAVGTPPKRAKFVKPRNPRRPRRKR